MGTVSNMRDDRNQNGQPVIKAFRGAAVLDRKVDEYIGVVKGMTADGTIHQGQLEYLLAWLRSNGEVASVWPASIVYEKLRSVLAKGRLDEADERVMLDLLLATVGGNTAPARGEASDSTALPFCSPTPRIVFPSRVFCFTGKFEWGTRDDCESAVMERGGTCKGNITKKLNYLVVGDVGSRDWLHSTYGRKIEQAVAYRDAGVPLAIVSERQWAESLV